MSLRRVAVRRGTASLVTAAAVVLAAAACTGGDSRTASATDPGTASSEASPAEADPPATLVGMWLDARFPGARLAVAGDDVLAGDYVGTPADRESVYTACAGEGMVRGTWVVEVAQAPALLGSDPLARTATAFYEGTGDVDCSDFDNVAADVAFAVSGDEAVVCTADGCAPLVRDSAAEVGDVTRGREAYAGLIEGAAAQGEADDEDGGGGEDTGGAAGELAELGAVVGYPDLPTCAPGQREECVQLVGPDGDEAYAVRWGAGLLLEVFRLEDTGSGWATVESYLWFPENPDYPAWVTPLVRQVL